MITLTERAQKYLLSQGQREQKTILSLSLRKYGCSGYAYDLKWEEQIPVNGVENKVHGLDEKQLVIYYNQEYADKLAGLEIDLEHQGFNKMIVFNNPKAQAHCGCGASVSFKDNI